MENIRVVATYTTLPSRYDILRNSIHTLLKQTRKLDAIYVTLPSRSKRLNQEYLPLPEDISSICTVVNIDVDYGPITKIYGAITLEKDINTVIISCDDDVFFDEHHVEVMLKHHMNQPNCCICGTGALLSRGMLFISIYSTVYPFKSWNGLTGFNISPEGKKVDLIFGVAGVLYTRGMFPNNDNLHKQLLNYSLSDDTIFHNDDILISGYLSKNNIDRKVFSDIPIIHHADGADALSQDIFKMIFRMNDCLSRVKNLGFFPTMEPLPVDETPIFRILFALIVLIIVCIICIYYYRST